MPLSSSRGYIPWSGTSCCLPAENDCIFLWSVPSTLFPLSWERQKHVVCSHQQWAAFMMYTHNQKINATALRISHICSKPETFTRTHLFLFHITYPLNLAKKRLNIHESLLDFCQRYCLIPFLWATGDISGILALFCLFVFKFGKIHRFHHMGYYPV